MNDFYKPGIGIGNRLSASSFVLAGVMKAMFHSSVTRRIPADKQTRIHQDKHSSSTMDHS